MALTGSYRINFTDPKKGNFIIEPYTANGTVTATSETLHHKATRADTSLLLYGQYVPNYGEQIHENMVRLLENFCGEAEPTNAIEGQLWYDVGDSFNVIGLSATGATIEGNQTAAFGQFAATGTVLTVWYGPLTIVDNTYTSVDVKVASATANVDGTTNVVLTNTEGAQYALPATAVGGFITVKQDSGLGRLRVRVKNDDDELVWADVVSFQCAPTAPPTETRMNGDAWYDTSTSLLKVYLNGVWQEVTKNHLPLSGGSMSGPIHMGGNVISFTGPVTASSTLTPKSYVDATVASAVADVSAGSNAAIDDLTTRLVAVETVLPNKLSRDGGNIRNALVFGDDAATPSVLKGIDMKNMPIANPLVTWNAADYLVAAADPHYVVDKEYVAKALSQHISDIVHNEKGYLLEQIDGRGLIPGNIYYDGDYSLSWNRNNTIYSTFVRENAFVIQTGSNAEDVLELRHGSQPPQLTNPSLAVGLDFVKSFQTLYLFDGQPQPVYGGGITDMNDDTAAASKGFVRTHVAAETSGLLPVIGGAFAYNGPANTYTLTLNRNGADPVSIDLFHTHRANTLSYVYGELANWIGGSEDLVKASLEANGIDLLAVPMSNMLTELNRWKAPIRGATFVDLPSVGSSFDVLSVDVPGNRFELNEAPTTLVAGMTVNIVRWDDILNFTVVSVVTEVDNTDPMDPWTSYWLVVEEPVPTDHDPAINQWKARFGWLTDKTEGHLLLTRTGLDFELDKKQDTIVEGTTAQYYRGDKTWATLDKAAVGLANVSNTSDANKPVSTATQTALDGKQDISAHLTVAASGNFTSAQNGDFIESTSATAITLTIPTGLPANWSAEVYQGGAGQVTIAADGGVTLRAPNGAKTASQYAVIKIRKLGTTETFVVYLDTVV